MKASVAVSLLALACAPLLRAEDGHPASRAEARQDLRPEVRADAVSDAGAGWALTDAQLTRLAAGAILSEGEVATDRAAADIRAAVQIDATPEQVFRTLTDCAEALRFVPHLKRCAVLDTGPDGRWQDVEQTVDYGWLAPRAHYVFHADYVRFERIHFTHLRGDFHENQGTWEFRPLKDGRATLVIYRARVAPAFFVPRWMMRSMLKRDLPELMRGLRTHAEAARPAAATNASPGGKSRP